MLKIEKSSHELSQSLFRIVYMIEAREGAKQKQLNKR